MPDARAPLRYHDGIETPEADEAQTIEAIIASLMRARLKTYQALSQFRHARNRAPETEPRSIDDVPA